MGNPTPQSHGIIDGGCGIRGIGTSPTPSRTTIPPRHQYYLRRRDLSPLGDTSTNSGVGTCRVGVYDVSGTQIGTSVAGVGMDQNINRIGIMSTQHGAVPAENTFFDNLIVDWTNGVFPLGIME